jgi:hypothetical protein
MTLIAFFVLFQSDPGYLTMDIMKDWDNGATLEGSPCDFAASEEEFENSHISETTTNTMNQGGLTPRNRHAAATTLSARLPNSSSTNDDDQVRRHKEMNPLTGSINTKDLARTSCPVCDTCGFAPPLQSHHCKICT